MNQNMHDKTSGADELGIQTQYRHVDALSMAERRASMRLERLQDIVFEIDGSGHLTFLNEAWTTILGYSTEDSLGQHISRFILSADRERVLEALLRQDGRPLSVQHLEARFTREDGTPAWVDLSATAAEDEYLVGLLHDISERKRVEEALTKTSAELEQEHSLFLSGAVVVFKWANREGWPVETVTPNVREVFGYSADEFTSGAVSYAAIIPEEDVGRVADEVSAPSQSGADRFVHEPYRIVRKDGKTIWIADYTTILRDESGTITHYLGYVFDVTERKQAEQDARDLAYIVERSLNEIYVFDAETFRFLQVNFGACQNLGYTDDELTAMTPLDIKPNLTTESFVQLVEPLRDGAEGMIVFETVHKRKDGSLYDVEVHLQLSEFVGKPVFVAIVLDITERKRAEGALRESEQRFRTIVTNATPIVFMFDREGRILLSEGKMLAAVGLRSGEVVGQSVFELYRDYPDVIAAFRMALDGETFEGIIELGELFFEVFYSPNRNADGNVTGVIGMALDITDRKRVGEDLRKSEEKYKSLFENMRDGFALHEMVFDENGTPVDYVFLDVNKAFEKLTGLARDKLIGRKVTDVLPGIENDPADWIATYGKVVLTGESISFENYAEPLQKWYSVLSYRPKEGQFAVLFHDITETRRLQQLESRAERLEMAGTIAGQVAHDFNNLLAPIMAYPGLIHEELPHGHKAHAYLDDIEYAAEKMASINQDLLTMGRRGHYSQDVLDLNRVVLRVAREMESRTKTVTIEMDLCKDLMRIKGGAAQIHRALTNLLVNAQDAMQDMGRIAIKTENYYADNTSVAFGRVPKGEYVKLTIADTGCGIHDDIVQKVLDPFFSTKTTDKKRGSGLGLSVVDAVVKDHNGYLDLSSKVGHGTSFYLYFPVTREVVGEGELAHLASGTESILIVDDDDIQREVSSQLLKKLGYKVGSVESGEKAVEFLRANPQDLVILDMVMPDGIDGTETYRRMLEFNPRQKVIILSGLSETSRVLEAQKLGAGAFVKKPITERIIAAAVRTELDRQRETTTPCTA